MKKHVISSLDTTAMFAKLRRAFGPLTQEQASGIEFLVTNPAIDGALTSQLAYMLATTWHETAKTMQPISEYGGPSYANARYDPVLGSTAARRARAKAMGNRNKGDGYKYRGRGYVQLTWHINYAKFGKILGVDLVGNPDLALVPDNAVRIMVVGMRDGLFTGTKLSDYVNSAVTSYVGARRVINGADKASMIAKYAMLFANAIST
jgi:putative chitinase